MGDFQETCKTISLSKLFKFFQLTIYVHVGKPLKDLARKELKKKQKNKTTATTTTKTKRG